MLFPITIIPLCPVCDLPIPHPCFFLAPRLPRAQLCRTCEIFNCARLVVHDRGVLDEPGFASIAVTAHHWLPIEEVRESRVAAYLQQQKRAGYTILALEQTAHSGTHSSFCQRAITARTAANTLNALHFHCKNNAGF
jgi:hypothetical protein